MITWMMASALAQTPPDTFGGYDVGDAMVLRPVGAAWADGFSVDGPVTESPFDRAILTSLTRRATDYDFVMVLLGQGVPRQMGSALAFNRTYDRDVAGTGRWQVDYDVAVQSGLYMNRTTVWDAYTEAQRQWVFNHELGHHWLAYLQVNLDRDRERALLGRQLGHWSYFLHTDNAPMEGNAWLDNGDGTFTTEPSVGPGGYSDLELYVMGLLPPEEVRPFFLIEPDDNAKGRLPSSSPDHWANDGPHTVSGERIDLTIDDIVAANGPATPGPDDSDRDLSILTVLVVAPEELVEEQDLQRLADLQEQWAAGFHTATRQLAQVSFDVVDEGLSVPPIEAPTWIPEAAR
ncbi:MAG: hypothetical protein KTR31_36245 [Myxococcales bacterium]|nr:hypothetical protein [Myxococcales bacterium]